MQQEALFKRMMNMVDKCTLKNDFFEIEYRTDALRISGITPTGKTNLLVDLADMPPVNTPYGDYQFLGGHRIWHAPEALPRTYIPDGEVQTSDVPNGVFLGTATEAGTGIQKCMEIRLSPNKASVTVTHTLLNNGLWTVELAPWAITQFRQGGTVILPMPVGNADPAGLLHNRQLSIWPYTRMNDPRVRWDDEFILFQADSLLPPFKIGYFNPHGWMAYWVDGVLFRKTFDVKSGLPHPDNNCNCEMYCNHLFVELESLGPLTALAPGASITHVETWDVFAGVESLPEKAQALLAAK
jgi:hypothetical protein